MTTVELVTCCTDTWQVLGARQSDKAMGRNGAAALASWSHEAGEQDASAGRACGGRWRGRPCTRGRRCLRKAPSRHCGRCPCEAARRVCMTSSCRRWDEAAATPDGARLRHRAVDAPARGGAHGALVRCQVRPDAHLAHPGRSGLLGAQAPSAAPSSVMRRPCRPEAQALACAQRKAKREGQLIGFIEESGLSERPTRVRTWAPKGQAPIIQFHPNWTHICVIAGLSRTNCLFRLHEDSIKKDRHVEFLKALRAHVKQPLLIIRDGLKAHRSRLVRKHLDSTDRWCLPGSVLAAVLARLESSRVPVGLAQAARLGRLLPSRPRRAQRHRSQQTQKRAASPLDHRLVLGTSWPWQCRYLWKEPPSLWRRNDEQQRTG